VSSDVAKNRIISAKQPDLDVQVTIKVQCESQIASLLMLMVIKFGAQKVKLINFVGLEEANEQRKLRKFFSFKTS
jgi:hypothetical protein